MVAFLNPELYKEFYNICKEQMGNSSLNKWEEYQLIIDRHIFEKVKQYVPINNYNGAKNNKGFRTSKNGRDTGIFKKINEQNNMDNNNIQINTDSFGNNYSINELNLLEQKPQKMINNSSINNIKIIPKNKIDIEEDEK